MRSIGLKNIINNSITKVFVIIVKIGKTINKDLKEDEDFDLDIFNRN